MSEIYDCWLELPETPAFKENIDAAMAMAALDGATSVTVKAGVELGKFEYKPAVGTESSSGIHLLHIRLRKRFTEAELIAYLKEPMSGPTPHLAIMSIISRDKIIPVIVDGETVGYEREVLKTFDKAAMLKYMPDIVTYNQDGSEASRRRPDMLTKIYLAGYVQTDGFVLEV